MNWSLRAAAPEDEDFLYGLHRSTMRVYVEETWGEWDEAWQRENFRRRFQPGQMQIIQVRDRDVGVISVEVRTEELYISRLQILPAWQRRGVGSAVVRELIAQARAQRKQVALRVLKVNREALSLYQRLGFGVTGETSTHYVMACS